MLPAKEAALPCESDGSAGLTLTNSGMLQHQALKHEALEHGQVVPALKGATMHNCCSSVLLERLCYVSAGMTEGDGDVKCSVLSAEMLRGGAHFCLCFGTEIVNGN